MMRLWLPKKSGSKYFTLIEVLIGLALTVLVLGVLFTSLYETSILSTRLEKAQRVVLRRAELQQRLDAIFSNLVFSNEVTSLFLSKNEWGESELHMQFRCGIDPDPAFSHQVNGVLALQKQGLCLQVIGNPLPQMLPLQAREEVIRAGVTKIKYEFLSHGDVFYSWEEKELHLPDYLKMTLFFENHQEEDYVFWLHQESVGIMLQ